MIKTLKSGVKTRVALGEVSQQTKASSLADLPDKTTKPLSALPPASQRQLKVAAAVSNASTPLAAKTVSVETLVKSLATDGNFFLPIVGADASRLYVDANEGSSLPSRSLIKDASITRDVIRPELVVRPEILAVQSFVPCEPGTANAESIDDVVNMQQLAMSDAEYVVDVLKSDDPTLSRDIEQNVEELSTEVATLRNDVKFMESVNSIRSSIVEALDLRTPDRVVKPSMIVRSHVRRAKGNEASNNDLISLVDRLLPESVDLPEILARIGHSPRGISSWQSTKLWLQLLDELKKLVSSHSEFLLGAGSYPINSDPSKIVRNSSKKLGHRPAAVVNIEQLVSTKPSDIIASLQLIESLSTSAYDGVKVNSHEDFIVALLTLISREHRLSVGLAREKVRRLLIERYQYSPRPTGNVEFIDAVLGDNINTVYDPAEQRPDSLASLSQRVEPSGLTLLFETEPMGPALSGKEKYVDPITDVVGARFNVSELEGLANSIDSARESFSSVVDGFNLLQSRALSSTNPLSQNLSLVVSSPVDMFNYVTSTVVERSTGLTKQDVLDDDLGGVFTAATRDVRMRAALFMLVMVKVSKTLTAKTPTSTADGTVLIDRLIDVIVNRLDAVSRASVASNRFKENSNQLVKDKVKTVTRDALRTGLKASSKLMGYTESLVREYLVCSRGLGSTLLDSVSRHAGFVDTELSMYLFDCIVHIIARFSNQDVVSSPQGASGVDGNLSVFNFVRTSFNGIEAIRSVVGRLEKETSRVALLVSTVDSILSDVSRVVRNATTRLSSAPTVTQLERLVSVVADQSLLKDVFAPGQINLISSFLNDASSRLSRLESSPAESIDDSCVSMSHVELLKTTLAQPEYSSAEGFNKSIMVVGITPQLASMLSTRAHVDKKIAAALRRGLINVAVYRVDQLVPGIVYRPQRFLFEMGRFVSRDPNNVLPKSENSQPVSDRVPFIVPADGDGVQYAAQDRALPPGASTAFFSSEYDLLTTDDRAELISNHVSDFVMSCYVRLTTGLNLDERQHLIKRTDRSPNLKLTSRMVDGLVQHVSDARRKSSGIAKGVLGSSRTSNRNTVTLDSPLGSPANVSLTTLSEKVIDPLIHGARVISGLGNVNNRLASSSALARQVMTPKKYDRVFFIPIDPDDFEIDVDEMNKTPHGREQLKRLLSTGDVVAIDDSMTEAKRQHFNRARAVGRRNRVTHKKTSFVHRDRERQQGDASFNKYFVVIESYDESGAR